MEPYWLGSLVESKEIWEEQAELKEALLKGPGSWFSEKKKTLTFQTTASAPHLLQTDASLKEAILTTVTLDFLRGFHFEPCARHDCGLPFLVDDKRKQFCSQYCGHLVSLRRTREKAKNSAIKGQTKSNKAKKSRTENNNVNL